MRKIYEEPSVEIVTFAASEAITSDDTTAEAFKPDFSTGVEDW